MISFEDFRPEGDAPIYVQVVLHIKRGIIAGTVLDGDALPSRRVLSATLGINPNTVQKAYKILEDEGLIVSYSGAGSVVVINETVVSAIRRELVEKEARTVVDAMKKMGIAKENAMEIIAALWEEKNE